MLDGRGPNWLAKASAGRYWSNTGEFLAVTAAMNRTSAALSRGFSTTVPDILAKAGTAPAGRSPSGMRGAPWTRSMAGGPVRSGAADAGGADRPTADIVISPSREAIRGTLQRLAMMIFLRWSGGTRRN